MLAGLTSTIQAAEPSALPLLSQIQDIRALSLEEARRGYPVRIHGVVTYFETHWRALFVQDGTGGIYVYPPQSLALLESGQSVEVEGTTGAGFAPDVHAVTIRVDGRLPLPDAPPTTFGRMMSGQDDSRFVAIEAVVRSLAIKYERLIMNLRVDGKQMFAFIPHMGGQTLPNHWLGAKVGLRGVVGAGLTPENQLVTMWLFVQDTNHVTILQPPPPDPFAQPATSLRNLLHYRPGQDESQRVKVTGTVTLARQRHRFFIRDETGGLEIKLPTPDDVAPDPNGLSSTPISDEPLMPGDVVEVVGYPSFGEFAPVLEDSIQRRIRSGPPPEPLIVDLEKVTPWAYDAGLIAVTARLLAAEWRRAVDGTNQVYTLQAGNYVFEAHCESADAPTLRPHSQVAVTGICSVQADEWRQPRSFRLLARHPDDVLLLEAPPRRFFEHAARYLVAAGVLAALALGWAMMLRQQVRRRTAQLAASEERFSQAFHASPGSLSILDLEDGRYLDVNDAFLATFGLRREEVIGKTSRDLNLWRDLDLRERLFHALREEGFFRNVETPVQTRTGKPVDIVQSAEVIDLDGRQYVLVFAQDITELKRAERESLRALARERELGEMKSHFVSMVSHEFRTPLEIIMSSGEILERYLDRLPPEERLRHLRAIHQSVRRMSHMMEEVLLLGRVESGKMEFKPAPLDLPAFCRRLVDEVHAAAGPDQKNRIVLKIAPDLPDALGDESMLSHIFTNLLHNALKYSPADRPVHWRVDEENGAGRFVVQDRGPGIPVHDQERLFQAFYRGRNVGQVPGTGLGLVIVKHFVELHGGRIQCRSGEETGTSFTVWLPLFDSPLPATFQPALFDSARREFASAHHDQNLDH